jgi:H+/gluconate symporter-like permease
MRFDTILPTLATKADLAELRTEIAKLSERLHEDMNKLYRQLIMWIVSSMIAMFLGMVGLFATISSNMLQTTERMMQAQVRAIEQAHAAAPRPPASP